MFGIIFVIAAALLIALSVGPLIRDIRKMHRRGRSLANTPSDAAGVSGGGMIFVGGIGTH
jgi:hypothetical protein